MSKLLLDHILVSTESYPGKFPKNFSYRGYGLSLSNLLASLLVVGPQIERGLRLSPPPGSFYVFREGLSTRECQCDSPLTK
jgi:hypothetical protein